MDNNKSILTHQITAAACLFLSNRGFEIVEAESSYSSDKVSKPCRLCEAVGYSEGCWKCGGTGRKRSYFLADVSAFGTPSRTELKSCGLRIMDNDKMVIAYPICALVEIKKDLADFKKDLTGKFSTVYAHLNYIAYPFGLLKPHEIPKGWFGLEMTKDGRRVYRLRREKGILHNPRTDEIKNLVTSVALRRYNRDTYQWYRDLQKELDGMPMLRTAPQAAKDVINEVIDSLNDRNHLPHLANRIVNGIRKSSLFPGLGKTADELQKKLTEIISSR